MYSDHGFFDGCSSSLLVIIEKPRNGPKNKVPTFEIQRQALVVLESYQDSNLETKEDGYLIQLEESKSDFPSRATE